MPIFRFWKPLLTRSEKDRVARVIAELEARTSGEIHVHLARRLPPGTDILALAAHKFKELGLDKTARRNGVLLLVAGADRKFAIWGDEGVHVQTGQALWDKAKEVLERHLRQGRAADGVEACLREIGGDLIRLFPKEGPDENEISDQVSQS
ncbi:MAG: TPM domain-containing protein [Elusimicrobia bacterium]|nr:TPM domain-containing protein [Elusimicrobiota bacterium]